MSLRLEVVPEKCVIIRRGRTCVAASWFGPFVRRPFVYPFLGPGDREVTRLGHPNDPTGHSHHRGIWIAHHDVGGVDFWSERKDTGRVEQTAISDIRASGPSVGALLRCSWLRPDGVELLIEHRRLAFTDLGRGELALDIDTRFEAAKEPVTLGKTNFGILGVRVAHTMRVHENLGGTIVNSNEAEDEAGCFGQHAEWIDYSGPVPITLPKGAAKPKRGEGLPATIVGIACFDHSKNSPRETQWHVRDDGWLGPGLTRDAARSVEPGRPVRARYRLESHAGRPWQADIAGRFQRWRSATD